MRIPVDCCSSSSFLCAVISMIHHNAAHNMGAPISVNAALFASYIYTVIYTLICL